MLHDFLFAPFADPAAAQLYQHLCDALRADPGPGVTLLLGNFAVEDEGAALDAVVVRPHSITVLVLVPRGGKLQMPALGYGAWQLDGHPLPGAVAEADNPYEQFRRQKDDLAAWLKPQFAPEQANLHFISGLVVFGAPVAFSPEVEEQLGQLPDSSFQLLAEAGQLPRRLAQLARPEIDLNEADLTEWAHTLANDVEPAPGAPTSSSSAPAAGAAPAPSFLRKAWSWLGADDIPEDAPYGQPAAQAAASSAEKERLEQVQREAQAQVQQQIQALEAREAARERRMEELRNELAQAPPVTTEAQALRDRLAAETQEKAALEEAIRASRAESESRNRDLDAKIQQLGQLIEQLNVRAAAAPDPAPAVAAVPAAVPSPAAFVAAASSAAPGPAVPVKAPAPALAAPVSAASAASPVSAIPVAATSASAAPPISAAPRAGAALPPQLLAALASFRRLKAWRPRLPRVAAVLGVAGLLGLGVWGLSHVKSGPPVPYQENGKWGLADASGTPVVPAKYSAVGPVQQERAVVEDQGVYGLIDEAGKEVVAPAYDALNPYAGGYARVRVGNAYTFLDEDGQEFADYYFNALDFSEGLAAVLDHRGWHYLRGPEPEDPAKPPVLFQEAYSFHEGLARVRLADGYTYITKDYLADPSRGTKPFGRYELATDFENGKARVTQSGRSFLIDTDGEPVK